MVAQFSLMRTTMARIIYIEYQEQKAEIHNYMFVYFISLLF